MAERDGKGRFLPGNKASPGRSPREREERFLEVTISSVSPDDWKAIVKKATEQAKRGDAVARKWLGDYLLGQPKQKVDLTSGDKPIEARNESTDRAISTLADAIGAAISGSGAKRAGPVDAPERPTVAGVPIEG